MNCLADMDVLTDLKNRFREHDQIAFERSDDGIVLLRINHPLATATISLAGGQVLAWQPRSQSAPVLWSSPESQWRKGRALRAGVPICWPWFGAHPEDPDLPAHGYARITPWEIVAVSSGQTGPLVIDMVMKAVFPTIASGGRNIILSTRISVGETLSIGLRTCNQSDQPFTMTEALHAYFNVGDIRNIHIDGLDGCEYIDLIDGNMRKKQEGPVRFSAETGRVYLNTARESLLHDPTYERTIKVEKSGSQSTVIWNPWQETASKMSDLGAVFWKNMVCIESANALDNVVTIGAGAQHTLSVSYSVQAMNITSQ